MEYAKQRFILDVNRKLDTTKDENNFVRQLIKHLVYCSSSGYLQFAVGSTYKRNAKVD